MKRFFDFLLSLLILIFISPVLIVVSILVWLQDFKSPLYIANRVGKNETIFRMIKLRSMIINAEKSGVDSTSSDDQRITKVGKLIRKFKLDELTQLLNVLTGSMSLVGPRPNVKRETDLYTPEEKRILTVRPGITDFASIVFSDEGAILSGKPDPDIAYNQLIRPGKSELAIFYIDHSSLILDIKLIALTAIAIFSRDLALLWLCSILKGLSAPEHLIKLASRKFDLIPMPPLGSSEIVYNRDKISER